MNSNSKVVTSFDDFLSVFRYLAVKIIPHLRIAFVYIVTRFLGCLLVSTLAASMISHFTRKQRSEAFSEILLTMLPVFTVVCTVYFLYLRISGKIETGSLKAGVVVAFITATLIILSLVGLWNNNWEGLFIAALPILLVAVTIPLTDVLILKLPAFKKNSL